MTLFDLIESPKMPQKNLENAEILLRWQLFKIEHHYSNNKPHVQQHSEFFSLYYLVIYNMAKVIHYGDDARKDVFQGIEMVAQAVRVTM